MTATDTKGGAKAFAESTFTGYNLDPKLIQVEPGFNARKFDTPENVEHVKNLAASIKAVGVQTPLMVRFKEGKFFLVDGESRLRAVKLAIKEGAEIKTVPVIQEGKHIGEVERVASLLSHNSGKQLNALERGDVFSRLKAYGWSDLDIAAKTGITAAHVSNILLLHAGPPAVQKLVIEGKASPTLAIQAIRDHGDDAAKVLKDAVASAAAAGKEKATAKDVAEPTKKKVKRDPLAFSRGDATQFFGGMVVGYSEKDLDRPAMLRIFRNIFEDILGEDWKNIVKDYYASMEDAG
jgi:ParB/RepB/Spo0J family partition protein